ncbi:peroxisome biogenesis factor 1-like isoform X1 [Helicoverpa zea]|uniref:peroxisome biogenesis factor 1-like isoform X1 n=2 Tax=Helicoverpa zea TaxID=7113 RepID=UPI001F5A81F7|nr:peroxisome biogenesis factor 1-like isoform X1 [Helicoverpa zea]XP_047042074.1 peroxisome biogenesis factor 1-like isoform X1 [Helicoverpa zea]
MLGGVKLKVTFTHEKTCFAYISPKYSTNNEQTQCVQVLCRDKQILLWVVFKSGVPEGQVACNPIYSRMVGLEEGADVFVSPYADLKVLNELYVETDSPDDQEILEHNVELLQMRILDQLRLVVANQKTVVWISASLPIVFTPKQTGILVNHSQIIVKMDAFNSIHPFPTTPVNVPMPKDNEQFKNIGAINKGMLAPYLNVPKRLVLRAVPIDSDGKKNLIHPYTVFIHEDFIDEKYKNLTIILATMTNIPSILNESDDDSENNNVSINDVCVEIVPIDSVIYRSLCREVHNKNIPTVLIPKPLNAIINIENGMRIIFTLIADNIEEPEHIDIITYSDQIQSEMDVVEKFKNCVIKSTHSGKRFLINNGMLKQNTEITPGFLQFKLKPDKLKFTMLDPGSFRNCTVAAKCSSETDMTLPKAVMSKMDYDYKNYCRTMKSMESLIEKVLAHVNFEIHREATFKGASEIKSNVLITGLSGTGKSSFCQIIQKELTVWSHILQCRSLRGRKDITEVLGKAILMCQEHSPAVLICDDVDALVPPNMEGASPQDIAYYQRLAVVIKHLLQTCSGVCVLMTALSMKDLHPTLRQFSGKPLFTAQFDVPELEKTERTELFKHLLNDKIRQEFEIEDDDVIKLAMDTAGFSVRDIIDYLNKKIFKAVKKKKSSPNDPKPRLVEDITKDEEKASEFDIWGPVGGLEEVKQELTECIFWPIMYPALFPSQSCGILLYGPPGTGKSHIGSCLARLTNMNMITVKGPELLSKYIGQSEKAVRDIFDKADMKRPCILFFDEFDSLAPKRGHDSTGVTDRVVNQLLARLDGAEGGARGPVLAATSRPDLVDPALLRAGRLQRHVYCALPDQQGRHEVLRTLTKSVQVDEAVDLQELAARTEGYSPADLKSILVTAQLTRLETQLTANEEKSMESVVVYKEDIESALAETKPSLSIQQRLFYDMIYKRFRGESLTDEQKIISKFQQKQRVTLA